MGRMRVQSLIPSRSTCLNLALLYSTANVYWHWETLARCQCPMHLWLIILYVCIYSVEVVSHVGSRSVVKKPGADNIAWYMHRSAPTARTAFRIIAMVLVPFVAFWAILGARWFALTVAESPDCFPPGTHLSTSFFVGCIAAALVVTALCSMFAVQAWQLGKSLERGEASLKAIQDTDMLNRWGEFLPTLDVDLQGMSAESIAALPSEVVAARKRKSTGSCPICLCSFMPGEKIRRLPGCQHCFHRPCVDLWLMQKGNCPMCKVMVRADPEPQQV